MPQWEFLDFLAEEAKRYPNFDLRMQARADRPAVGERARRRACARKPRRARSTFAPTSPSQPTGANRCCAVSARLDVIELGAPMDVLWLRLTKHADDPHETFGYIRGGRIMALIDRGAYWQCAYVIPKGTLAELQARGLEEFRREVGAIVPFLARPRRGDRELGRRQAADRARQPLAASGTGPGCSASAMRRTRCRRSAASASTWRFKTRSRPPTCSAEASARRRDGRRSARAFSGGANAPRESTQALQLFIQSRIIGRVLADGRAPLLRRLPRLVRMASVPTANSRPVGGPRLPAREHVLNLLIRQQPDQRLVVQVHDLHAIAERIDEVASKRRNQA